MCFARKKVHFHFIWSLCYDLFRRITVDEENRYSRLGDFLRDRLSSDDDPFEAWDPLAGKRREAGKVRAREPRRAATQARRRVAVPEELVEDFRTLGLPPGVSAEECKAAWRTLLKKHHPDANAGDASANSAHAQITRRVTESYRRIASWYETGSC